MDPDCQAPKSNTATTQCENSNSQCYVYSAYSHVVRGCSDDGLLDVFPPNGIHIEECSGAMCNDYPIENTCIVCDSIDDRNCTFNPSSIETSSICSLKHRSHVNYSRCFRHITSYGRVRRGCLNDLEESEQDDFINSVWGCDTCFGTNCNRKWFTQQTC